MSLLACVITTIQLPTPAVGSLSGRLGGDSVLIIIGDRKGPVEYPLDRVRFLSLADQLVSSHSLARVLPVGHYTRKNVGYLEAIQAGVQTIYETDDDNAPLPTWRRREETANACRVLGSGWVNVYRCFSELRIWPRGLPLDALATSFANPVRLCDAAAPIRAPIQQGLANGSPDVDAIWRLVLDQDVQFADHPSVALPRGAYCPFNSQSTWWWPDAYPLLYLPSNCSFRMTDIWRSFVAQRCLWEFGGELVFHTAEVVQDRNQHNLMHDFQDEIPGYIRNRELVEVLEGLTLETGVDRVESNLRVCYEALVAAGFFPGAELDLVDAWLTDLARIRRSPVDPLVETHSAS